MLFNSFTFLIFFPVVAAVYFVIPQRLRWAWLLAASCYFYMAFIPVYILILFFTIGIDYAAGILIENATGTRRKSLLVVSILANVGVLGVFKYFNFFWWKRARCRRRFQPSVRLRAARLHSAHRVVVPHLSGDELHYRNVSGKQRAERHAGIYALYVT